MKKKSLFKILVFTPAVLLTACGYGLKEVYTGIPYNSTNFEANYYNVWDKAINHNSGDNNITETKKEIELDYVKDSVFTRLENKSFEEDYMHFKNCEPLNWEEYHYTYDKVAPEEGLAYGPAVALKNVDNSFKYGVKSKLFDGQMFCNGDYQQSRTQVGPSNIGKYNGFGIQFSKECTDSSYFMCNFKCSVVTDKNQNIGYFNTDLKIKLGFYLKNNEGYTYIPVTYVIEKVPTNSGDDHFMPPFSGRLTSYVCFGFKLNDTYLNLSRLAGFSFEYELIDVYKPDTHKTFDPGEDTMFHSIMLYEVSLPHSTWH